MIYVMSYVISLSCNKHDILISSGIVYDIVICYVISHGVGQYSADIV